MKIILSRKGLDSGFKEAKPSPILPRERLLSLPIPVTPKQMLNGENGISYADMRFNGQSISEIINQLYNHNHQFPYNKAHLDPDLDRERLLNRKEGWHPVFGQKGSGAQGHLNNQGVKEGDLFLFFGRFRRTTRNENGGLKYVSPEKGNELHVIFGWLQVGKPLLVNRNEIPDWLQYHPHIVNKNNYQENNTIYISSDKLTLDGHDLSLRGAGTFSCFKHSLQLTAPEGPISHWHLPKWFYPFGQSPREPLSYHTKPEIWTPQNDHVILKTVRGQEFVFDTEDYPEAIGWIKTLFKN